MSKICLSIALFTCCGCMSTKVQFSPTWNPASKPAYEDYFDFYFLGFVGNPSVNVQQACVDQKPLALKKYNSPEDILIGVITLGIYTPATVKVWCGE